MAASTRRDRLAKAKRELLRALIEREGDGCTNAIVFCNRKTDVDIVAKSLKRHGFNAAPIHGDLEQSHRTRTLDAFRDGELRFLVASDVAARGLDIPSVSHFFNFDVPSHSEDYVHRIGRTGRAGQDGAALSLVCVDEHAHLADIEKLLKRQIDQVIVPGYEPDPSIRPEPIKRGGGRGGNSRPRNNGNNGGGQRRARNASAKAAPGKRSRKPSRGNNNSKNRSWRSAAA